MLDYQAIRQCANLIGNTSGADRWSAHEWMKLYAAYLACEWDFPPDRWTAWQWVAAIVRGTIPRWDDRERPIGAENAQSWTLCVKRNDEWFETPQSFPHHEACVSYLQDADLDIDDWCVIPDV